MPSMPLLVGRPWRRGHRVLSHWRREGDSYWCQETQESGERAGKPAHFAGQSLGRKAGVEVDSVDRQGYAAWKAD
ncbi:hypothetical protein SK128_020154, partial [Halocaridina rubra]